MRTPVRNAGWRTDGFTLIEMLVVLAILALAATVALPYVPTSKREPSLAAVSDEIAAGLRLARSLAISAAEATTVEIDLKRRELRFPDGSSVGIGRSRTMTAIVGRETVDANGTATIAFLPQGGSSGAEIVLSEGMGSVIVEVNWLTGLTSRREVAP
jgi:general secretion pathway protein H